MSSFTVNLETFAPKTDQPVPYTIGTKLRSESLYIRATSMKLAPKRWVCRFTFSIENFVQVKGNVQLEHYFYHIQPHLAMSHMHMKSEKVGLSAYDMWEIDTWEFAVFVKSDEEDYEYLRMNFEFFPNYNIPTGETFYRVPYPLNESLNVNYVCRPFMVYSYVLHYLKSRPRMIKNDVIICDAPLRMALGKPFIAMNDLSNVLQRAMVPVNQDRYEIEINCLQMRVVPKTVVRKVNLYLDEGDRIYPWGWALRRTFTRLNTNGRPTVPFSPFQNHVTRARTLKWDSNLSLRWALDFDEDEDQPRKKARTCEGSDITPSEEDLLAAGPSSTAYPPSSMPLLLKTEAPMAKEDVENTLAQIFEGPDDGDVTDQLALKAISLDAGVHKNRKQKTDDDTSSEEEYSVLSKSF